MSRKIPKNSQNSVQQDEDNLCCVDGTDNNSLYRVGVRYKQDSIQVGSRLDTSEKKTKGPPCVTNTPKRAKRLLPPTELCILSQEPTGSDCKPIIGKQNHKKPRKHLRTFQCNIENVESRRPKDPFYDRSKETIEGSSQQSPRPVRCLLKGKRPIQILAKVMQNSHGKKIKEGRPFDYRSSPKQNLRAQHHRPSSTKISRYPSNTIQLQLDDDSPGSCDDDSSSRADDAQQAYDWHEEDGDERRRDDYLTCTLVPEYQNPCRGNAETRLRRREKNREWLNGDDTCHSPYSDSIRDHGGHQALVPARRGQRQQFQVQREPTNLLARIRQKAIPTYSPPHFPANYMLQVCPKCKDSSILGNKVSPTETEGREEKAAPPWSPRKTTTDSSGARSPVGADSKPEPVKSDRSEAISDLPRDITQPPSTVTQDITEQPSSGKPSPSMSSEKNKNASFYPNSYSSLLPNKPFLSEPSHSSSPRTKVCPCERSYKTQPYEIIKVNPEEMPIVLCRSDCAKAAEKICFDINRSSQQKIPPASPQTHPTSKTTNKTALNKCRYPRPKCPPIGAATDLSFDVTPQLLDTGVPCCGMSCRCKLMCAFLTLLRWMFMAFIYVSFFVVIIFYYNLNIFAKITLMLICLFLIFLLQIQPDDLFIYRLMTDEPEQST